MNIWNKYIIINHIFMFYKKYKYFLKLVNKKFIKNTKFLIFSILLLHKLLLTNKLVVIKILLKNF